MGKDVDEIIEMHPDNEVRPYTSHISGIIQSKLAEEWDIITDKPERIAYTNNGVRRIIIEWSQNSWRLKYDVTSDSTRSKTYSGVTGSNLLRKLRDLCIHIEEDIENNY